MRLLMHAISTRTLCEFGTRIIFDNRATNNIRYLIGTIARYFTDGTWLCFRVIRV